MSNFFVYILKCNDNSYYTGHTDNLEKRIAEHNAKSFDGYTAARLPIEVLYVEAFTTRDEAFKGWSRKKKEALIKKNWDELIKLSNFGRSNGSTSSPRAE